MTSPIDEPGPPPPEAASSPRRAARTQRPAAPVSTGALTPVSQNTGAVWTAPTSAVEQASLWQRIRNSFLFQLLVTFVVMGLILSFIAKPYFVPSGSMEETLMPGDRVLVNRLDKSPDAGEIFVFDADESWQTVQNPPKDAFIELMRWIGRVSGFGPSGDHTLVKRVIGLPGDTVECCNDDGAILVNDVPLVEPYLGSNLEFVAGERDCTTTPRSERCFPSVTVPEERYLMLGDNRVASSDSAQYCRATGAPPTCWRWASQESLVGKAVLILWPFSRWSGL